MKHTVSHNERRSLKMLLLSIWMMIGASSSAAALSYSVLVEADPGGLGNSNYGEFDSLLDVKLWNVSSQYGIGQNVFGTGSSVGGYTYDGSDYHVLVEDDPGGAGNLRLFTFHLMDRSHRLPAGLLQRISW